MSQDPEIETIQRVARSLAGRESILVITGAGLSADSGLPTYRGIGGLYEEKLTGEGLEIETVLSGATLRTRPELTWKYLIEIERATRGATFNRGHQVIAEMEAHFPRVWTLTQNVDGFHGAAGSRNVIDIHGDLHELFCVACEFRRSVPNYEGLAMPPHCPGCGAVLRPDVVLFGEMLPMTKMDMLYREWDRGFDMVFSIGTSSLFPYIAEPIRSARALGVPTVEINPGETEVSALVTERIRHGAARALDAIWDYYRSVAV